MDWRPSLLSGPSPREGVGGGGVGGGRTNPEGRLTLHEGSKWGGGGANLCNLTHTSISKSILRNSEKVNKRNTKRSSSNK